MVATSHLTLGPTYSPDLWDLRKRIAQNRRTGVPITMLEIRAPITSPAIDVALSSGSLYLVGLRRQGGQWLEFANDAGLRSSADIVRATPRLPQSRWIRVGGDRALSSYRALRLPDMLDLAATKRTDLGFTGTPGELLGLLAAWDGALNAPPERLRLCVLIFLVCEALRFRSIETACAGWIGGRGAAAQTMTFVITRAMLAIVQNWHGRAGKNDPDVWTWPPEMADRLID